MKVIPTGMLAARKLIVVLNHNAHQEYGGVCWCNFGALMLFKLNINASWKLGENPCFESRQGGIGGWRAQ